MPSIKTLVLAGAVALLPVPTAALAQSDDPLCRAERAIYTLKSDPAFTAGFVPSQHFASMASDLYFWIKSPQRTYWFTLQVSNGYSTINMDPVGDPYVAAGGDPNNGPVELDAGDLNRPYMSLYPMRKDLTVLDMPPSAGQPAPYALFAPGIGVVLWYAPAAISTDKSARRDPMTRGIFIRTGCLAETPPPALP